MEHYLPGFEALEHFMGEARDKSGLRPNGWPIFILGLLIFFNGYLFFSREVVQAIEVMVFTAPVWLTAIVLSCAWGLWMIMIRSYYIAGLNYIVLEIKPPRSIEKTPLAMETVLAGLYHSPGESTWYSVFVQGKVRPYFSFEIASLEGQVHFYVWTRANFRKLVESAFYAQYPGVQITEVEDYTRTIEANPVGPEWMAWGCDFKHTRSEDAYPIKTYVDYGLDKVQEETEQTDPLANLIEFLGSVGKGEYLWVQFIFRVHLFGEKYGKKLNSAGKPYTWKDQAKEIVQKIREETRQPFTDPATGKEVPGFPNPTKQQIETMGAIERNVSKLAFDVGARAIYINRPEKFDPVNITGIIGLFKAFSSEGWNGIKATRWLMEYADYPWELGNNKRKARRAKELVNAYRRRQYFHEPFEFMDHMVMSTEELATLFHVPSRAVESPSLPRIESATGEAPTNLPT
jgi:hypothetical protein